MSLKFKYFLVAEIILLFIDHCDSNNAQNFRSVPLIGKGFGPYYVATRSLEKCKSASVIDTDHNALIDIAVKKISRTEEEYVGNTTAPNDVQIINATIEFKKWQDGGFRTEFRKTLDRPCSVVGVSLILKNNFNPDKNCKIKKGTYEIKGLNPNYIMHLIFQNYHYERYLITIDWNSKKGSVGCVTMMCEVKPLKKSKRPK